MVRVSSLRAVSATLMACLFLLAASPASAKTRRATRAAEKTTAGKTAKVKAALKKAVVNKGAVKKVAAKTRATRGRAAREQEVAVAPSRRGRRVREVSTVEVRRGRLVRVSRTRYQAAPGPVIAGGPWLTPTFANSTEGDNVDGEDLVVRRAAVEALGPLNGTVVVTDPYTGRILTMVNQKLALSDGFQPCSTIKVVAALAALSEGIVDRTTPLRVGGGRWDMTNALARSNNGYFANLGIRLGYDRVAYYAKQFGLGEKTGYNLEGEQLGTIPDGPPANGGMGMMTSFGEGIHLTPLQLSGLLTAIANGGTLYYLQAPRTAEEIANFQPRVKRHLEIQPYIPEVKPGMLGATEFGTARRASYDANEPIFGKTGTCTDRRSPTHLGWFGSFVEAGDRKLVVTVLLTGGRPVNGPMASEVAGNVYKALSRERYFQAGQAGRKLDTTAIATPVINNATTR